MPDDLDTETAAMIAVLRALRDISPAGRIRIARALAALTAPTETEATA